MSRFDYLKPAQGAVVEGLEGSEKIYALEQAQYLPLRTLLGENGASAIYRLELTDEQREMLAGGADILVEILHYGGPLAPSRVMLLNQKGIEPDKLANFLGWFKAQTRLLTREEDSQHE